MIVTTLTGLVVQRSLRDGKYFSTIEVKDARFPASTDVLHTEDDLCLGTRVKITVEEEEN
jgi:hypothetical protein